MTTRKQRFLDCLRPAYCSEWQDDSCHYSCHLLVNPKSWTRAALREEHTAPGWSGTGQDWGNKHHSSKSKWFMCKAPGLWLPCPTSVRNAAIHTTDLTSLLENWLVSHTSTSEVKHLRYGDDSNLSSDRQSRATRSWLLVSNPSLPPGWSRLVINNNLLFLCHHVSSPAHFHNTGHGTHHYDPNCIHFDTIYSLAWGNSFMWIKNCCLNNRI